MISSAWLWLALLLVGNAAASDDAITLANTHEFTLLSTKTGHEYLVQVAVPEVAPPDEGYPVLYVLDGNARLPLMLAARDTLTRRGESMPWLMVGVGYTDAERLAPKRRALDYTPPLLDARYAGQKNSRPAGGAEAFLDFIEQRLKPAVSERFAVNSAREALMGHSFGGLFTLYALHQRPESFSDYIAVSPSLWWNFGDLFDGYCRTLKQAGEEGGSSTATLPRVMIARGSEEGARIPEGQPQGISTADYARESRQTDKADRLAERLQRCRPGWDARFTLFDGESHGSVMWPAARSALAFLGEGE